LRGGLAKWHPREQEDWQFSAAQPVGSVGAVACAAWFRLPSLPAFFAPACSNVSGSGSG
jgi:hypothetical protein